ncbi:hypothetical protein V2J09_018015, partial [Rumex salicifolius]
FGTSLEVNEFEGRNLLLHTYNEFFSFPLIYCRDDLNARSDSDPSVVSFSSCTFFLEMRKKMILLLQLVGHRFSHVRTSVPIRLIRNGSVKHSIRGPVMTLLCGIHSRSALRITFNSGCNSSQKSTTSPSLLPSTLSRTSIETKWFHVLSSIGYSSPFVSISLISVSISAQD